MRYIIRYFLYSSEVFQPHSISYFLTLNRSSSLCTTLSPSISLYITISPSDVFTLFLSHPHTLSFSLSFFTLYICRSPTIPLSLNHSITLIHYISLIFFSMYPSLYNFNIKSRNVPDFLVSSLSLQRRRTRPRHTHVKVQAPRIDPTGSPRGVTGKHRR